MGLRTRVLEQPSGRGTLYLDGTLAAEVSYKLHITQSMYVTRRLFRTATETPGLRYITGRLSLTADEAARLVGESLTLELDDGRRLPLYVRNAAGDVEADGWFEE